MSIKVDNRQVVLLKSLRTNNRFYTLVDPDSGLKNAGAIADFPPDLLLGIAYPCLEDGLNDFAVIRTTFETIDVFPDDDELRVEMMSIINDARGNMVRRLEELRDKVRGGRAIFLGTDLSEFKSHLLHMATRGAIRRTLDNMMKLDVFESVSKHEASQATRPPDPMYRYEFETREAQAGADQLEPREFAARLFDDVLHSVNNDQNYLNKHVFDRNVFQKFIAVMFVNYATTPQIFYGTSRDDYGVSSDKDMNDTPLYQAVAAALREFERTGRTLDFETGRARPLAGTAPTAVPEEEEADLTFLFDEDAGALTTAGHAVTIPFGAAERMLLEPLARLAEVVRLLEALPHPRADEIRTLAASAGREIFRGLQELQIISPLASDPLDGQAPES